MIPQAPQSPQRPVRPVGVVLSAIALGLAAGMFLLFTLGGLAAVLHGAPGTAAASSALNTMLMLVMTLVYVALAGWAIATLAGLLRMRPWARVSAMIIAGCMVGFGLLSALGMTGAQSLIASGSVPLPSGVDSAMLHKVLLVFGVLALLVAGLGIVWLIYFASRGTREAFTRAEAAPPAPDPSLAYGDYPPPGAPAWPARPPQPRPDPLTDFTVARPLETPPSAPPFPEQPAARPSSEDRL